MPLVCLKMKWLSPPTQHVAGCYCTTVWNKRLHVCCRIFFHIATSEIKILKLNYKKVFLFFFFFLSWQIVFLGALETWRNYSARNVSFGLLFALPMKFVFRPSAAVSGRMESCMCRRCRWGPSHHIIVTVVIAHDPGCPPPSPDPGLPTPSWPDHVTFITREAFRWQAYPACFTEKELVLQTL